MSAPHIRGVEEVQGGGGGVTVESARQAVCRRERAACHACIALCASERALGMSECCCESMCAARDKGAMCTAKRRAGALDSSAACAGVGDRVSLRDEVATHGDARRIPPSPSLACANHPDPTAHAGMKGLIPLRLTHAHDLHPPTLQHENRCNNAPSNRHSPMNQHPKQKRPSPNHHHLIAQTQDTHTLRAHIP